MDKKQYNLLGLRILELQGRMTETELCAKLGMSRNQLYNIKRGKTGTSPATIERLVQVFKPLRHDEVQELYRLAGFVAPDSVSAPEPSHSLSLPEWLKRLRVQQRMTPKDLAEYAYCDTAEIEALEAGVAHLDDTMLMRLIVALQPGPESLVALSHEDRKRVADAKSTEERLMQESLGSENLFASGRIMHVTGPPISQPLPAFNLTTQIALKQGQEFLMRISKDAMAYSLVLRLLEYWADKVSTDKLSTDKLSTDKLSTDKLSTDKLSTDKLSTEPARTIITEASITEASIKASEVSTDLSTEPTAEE